LRVRITMETSIAAAAERKSMITERERHDTERRPSAKGIPHRQLTPVPHGTLLTSSAASPHIGKETI
jgi:hypothetical protein